MTIAPWKWTSGPYRCMNVLSMLCMQEAWLCSLHCMVPWESPVVTLTTGCGPLFPWHPQKWAFSPWSYDAAIFLILLSVSFSINFHSNSLPTLSVMLSTSWFCTQELHLAGAQKFWGPNPDLLCVSKCFTYCVITLASNCLLTSTAFL